MTTEAEYDAGLCRRSISGPAKRSGPKCRVCLKRPQRTNCPKHAQDIRDISNAAMDAAAAMRAKLEAAKLGMGN